MKSSLATLADDREFATFSCCPPEAEGWRREPENFVRAAALRRAEYVLALRDDDDQMVAVSAFDPTWTEHIPLVEPRRLPAWFLFVVAIRFENQGEGLSGEVFEKTFETMREIDRTRGLVMARVHGDHGASIKACGNVGLDPLILPGEDEYIDLLGRVPGTADPLG